MKTSSRREDRGAGNIPVPPFIDPREVRKALSVLAEPDQVFEVRILEPERKGQRWNPKTMYGYFDNPDLVYDAITAARLTGAKGVYITLNPVQPELLARCSNRITEAKSGDTTADQHILRRRWLLIDCDPVRPAGISATDKEKAQAQARVQAVYSVLKDAGWPEPVQADSGNGYHLLYRIDLPADDGGLVNRCLEALAKRHNDDAVAIDTAVHNAARICKLYGTRARKGDDCPQVGRVWRMARLLQVPDEIESVPREKLEQMASEAAEAADEKGAVDAQPQPRLRGEATWHDLTCGNDRPTRPNDAETVEYLLTQLGGHRCDDYGTWLKVGMACKDARCSLGVWENWSRRSSRYQERICAAKWESFNGDASPVTIGTLVKWVKEDGGTWPPPRSEVQPADKPEATDKRRRPTIPVVLASDWLTSEHREPVPVPVLDGFLDHGLKLMVTGPSKARKSFLLADLALALAGGRCRFLCWDIPRAFRVLLVQAEVPAFHFQRRLAKIKASHEAEAGRPLDLAGLAVVNGRGLDCARLLADGTLAMLATEHAADVAIFDPLYKLLPKGEETAEEFKGVLASFDRLAESGPAVIFCQHCPKGRPGDRDTLDRAAGSGWLARDFDAAIFLAPHANEAGTLVVEPVSRCYPPTAPFTITFDADTSRFRIADATPEVQTSRTAATRKAAAEIPEAKAMQMFAAGPLPATVFRQELERLGPQRAARVTCDRLLAAGRIVQARRKGSHGCIMVGTPEQIAAVDLSACQDSQPTETNPPASEPASSGCRTISPPL